MAKYQGLTNSSQFLKNDRTYDIDKAFEYYAGNIKNAKKNLISVIADGKYTEEQLQFMSQQLADEFYTLVVALKPLK